MKEIISIPLYQCYFEEMRQKCSFFSLSTFLGHYSLFTVYGSMVFKCHACSFFSVLQGVLLFIHFFMPSGHTHQDVYKGGHMIVRQCVCLYVRPVQSRIANVTSGRLTLPQTFEY